jgi:hypothetical protein
MHEQQKRYERADGLWRERVAEQEALERERRAAEDLIDPDAAGWMRRPVHVFIAPGISVRVGKRRVA